MYDNKYVIGIDGGGTNSTLKIFRENGVEIGSRVGDSTNMSAKSIEKVRKTLNNLIVEALEDTGISMEDVAVLCIGTAGAGRMYQAEMLKSIIRGTGMKGEIIVNSDAHIALVAGTGKEEGIIVIAGTGSIAYGKTKEGRSHRAGGWGHIIGDEGSAYYIARMALNQALRSYDGRRSSTILLPMLMEAINADSIDKFIGYIYSQESYKSKVAKLAQVVDKASQNGDEAARYILRQGAYELFLLVDSVVKALDVKSTPITLVTSGSVLLRNEFVFKSFRDFIEANYTNLQIVKLNKDPAYGAVCIAMKFLHST